MKDINYGTVVAPQDFARFVYPDRTKGGSGAAPQSEEAEDVEAVTEESPTEEKPRVSIISVVSSLMLRRTLTANSPAPV